MSVRGRIVELLSVFSWKLRRWFHWPLAFICWWRGKHTGFYARGLWICRICAKQERGRPPDGSLIVTEDNSAIHQVQPDGSLRRIDKFRGSKKQRRKNKEKVQALADMRRKLIEGSDV